MTNTMTKQTIAAQLQRNFRRARYCGYITTGYTVGLGYQVCHETTNMDSLEEIERKMLPVSA